MPETLFPPSTRIKGFRPALENIQLPEPSVVDGQNFLLDAQGPFTAFGSIAATGCCLPQPEYLETFKIDDFMIIMYLGIAFKYESDADLLIPVYTFSDTGDLFPWSHAVVGDKHYFCRKGTGVIEFDPVINQWAIITTDVPTGPVMVAQSGGRLVIEGADRVAYSAIGNGADLAPSLTTGAGFQLLVEHTGGGAPLGVYKVDDGFISFTERGIMKSEVISGAGAFRHFGLSSEASIVPLTQFTILDIQESGGIVFLGKGGFYITRGELPQQWQPLMSEFFRASVLTQFNLSNVSLIRLAHSEDKQWFFVSVAQTEQPFLYPIAYVLYLPLDEWGVFNRVHRSLGQYNFKDIEQGFNFGYTDFVGNLRRFIDDAFVQATPDLNTDYAYHAVPDIEGHYEVIGGTSTAVFSTMLIFDIYNPAQFTGGSAIYSFERGRSFRSPLDPSNINENSVAGNPNVFECDLELAGGITLWEARKQILDNNTIDSSITIGVYRLTENQSPDELAIITNVTTHTGIIAVGGEQEDWLTFVPETTEDWDVLSGEEDWGDGGSGIEEFNASLIGTLDGKTQWLTELELLENPLQSGGTRHYGAYNSGIYSLVKIDALTDNQNFHLKSLELSGINGGRL